MSESTKGFMCFCSGILSGHTLLKGQMHPIQQCQMESWLVGKDSGAPGLIAILNKTHLSTDPGPADGNQSIPGMEGCTLQVAVALTKTSSTRLSPRCTSSHPKPPLGSV